MQFILNKLGFDRKTFFRFFIIVANSQLIYSFVALRSVLYDPMVEALGVTNTQFGVLMGFVGFVGLAGGMTVGWIQDRFSIRKVLAINSFFCGGFSLIMTLWPACPYYLKCLFFIFFGFNTDALYWATVLKSVRIMAKDDHQATAFGLMESLRGMWELVTNTIGVAIFTVLGSTILGMRAAMGFTSAIILFSGVLIWFCIPEENLQKVDGGIEKTKMAFKGYIKALRMPAVWMTGLGASCVYATYCAVNTYFVPYLKNVYFLPVALVSVFGLINSAGTRFTTGPIAGLVADLKFKSSAHLMRACFGMMAILLVAALVMPKNDSLVIPAMILLFLIAIFCCLIRGVYYAPIGEMGVPREMSGAAMVVASFIGYSPSFWAYPVYGKLIDTFGNEKAYTMIFCLLIVLAVAGFVINTLMGCRIVAQRALKTED